jgi:hypothetical protein
MITIKNYGKLFRKDVGQWRVSRIDEEKSFYQITLMKPDGETVSVNLERNEVRGIHGNGFEYEMWYWKGMSNNPNNALPERLLFTADVLNTIDKFTNALNLLLM